MLNRSMSEMLPVDDSELVGFKCLTMYTSLD